MLADGCIYQYCTLPRLSICNDLDLILTSCHTSFSHLGSVQGRKSLKKKKKEKKDLPSCSDLNVTEHWLFLCCLFSYFWFVCCACSHKFSQCWPILKVTEEFEKSFLFLHLK